MSKRTYVLDENGRPTLAYDDAEDGSITVHPCDGRSLPRLDAPPPGHPTCTAEDFEGYQKKRANPKKN